MADMKPLRMVPPALVALAMLVAAGAAPASAQPDTDGDGIPDDVDNCPETWNPDQTNTDLALKLAGASVSGDGLGDACDDDDDNDGATDTEESYIGTQPLDNCPHPEGPGPNGNAWRLDINQDSIISAVGDLLPFRGRVGAWGGPPPDPNWWVRLDFSMDNWITAVGDLLMYWQQLGRECW